MHRSALLKFEKVNKFQQNALPRLTPSQIIVLITYLYSARGERTVKKKNNDIAILCVCLSTFMRSICVFLQQNAHKIHKNAFNRNDYEWVISSNAYIYSVFSFLLLLFRRNVMMFDGFALILCKSHSVGTLLAVNILSEWRKECVQQVTKSLAIKCV